MRILAVLGPSIVLAAACRREPADPDRDRPGTDSPTPPTTEPAWVDPVPVVWAQAPVQGEPNVVEVSQLPVGAAVEVWISDVGLEDVCDEDTWECLALIDPVMLGTGTADEQGRLTRSHNVAASAALGAIFYRVRAVHPETGAEVWSLPIQRDLMQPRSMTTLKFSQVQAKAGLSGFTTSGNSHTGGVAWVDVDGDLWPDLFVSNGGYLPHRLFHNLGDGTFEDWSDRVPKVDDGAVEDAGVWYADIDNDGDEDILVPGDSRAPLDPFVPQPREGGPNQLYRNEGDGTFTEVGKDYGIRDPEGARNITAAFADYDRDGFIDLYVGQWTIDNEPAGVHDDYDRLLRNRGDGTFDDVTAQTGVDGLGLDALTAMWLDPDQDGWPDLYIGNVSHQNDPPVRISDDVLYHNVSGAFELWRPAMPWVGDDAWAAMGMDVGDIDNDGFFDLYISDWWPTRPIPYGSALYMGQPDGLLSENRCDVQAVCTGYTGWPASFADFDSDGWIDLYAGNARADQPDLLFWNQGGRLVNQSVRGLEGMTSHGGAQADFDGDGDVDLYVWTLDQTPRLLGNTSPQVGHWLELKLVGTASNRGAIGAVARVTTSSHTLMRRVTGADSSHSQSEAILHFGLGDDDVVDVSISWPSGAVSELADVGADQLWLVDEDGGLLAEEPLEASATYDPVAGTVDVSLRTNYGGRTAPSVLTEALVWQPADRRWTLEGHPLPGPLPFVLVTTPRASFRIPVTAR